MMKRSSPLCLAMLVACVSQEQLEQEPEILDVSVDCLGDEAEVTAIVGDDVVNVTAVYEDTTWFAVEQSPNKWEAEEAADCEGTWEIELTVVNAFARTSSTTLYWPVVEPDTDGVEPPYGTTAGGQEVVISGDDLELAEVVLFGSEVATILSATEEGLVVLTPAHEAGSVDVSVEATGNVGVLEQAFTYHQDAEGLSSSFGLLTLYLYDPAWFSIGSGYDQLETYGPFVDVGMAFLEPTEPANTYIGAMPEPGSCVWDGYEFLPWAPSSYVLIWNQVPESYVLTTDDWVYSMVLEDVNPDDWLGQVFDVEIPVDNEALPAQTLQQTASIPSQPIMSADWQSLNPVAWGADIELSWTDYGLDGLEYTVYAINSNHDVLSEYYCTAAASDELVIVSWDELTGTIDTNQLAAFVVHWRFWEDTRTEFVHDRSHFWGRGFLDIYTRHPLQ